MSNVDQQVSDLWYVFSSGLSEKRRGVFISKGSFTWGDSWGNHQKDDSTSPWDFFSDGPCGAEGRIHQPPKLRTEPMSWHPRTLDLVEAAVEKRQGRPIATRACLFVCLLACVLFVCHACVSM